MNHFQVIYGLLQLKKFERAKEYISQISLELHKEGQIYRIGDNDLVSQLLLTIHQAKQIQVAVVIQISEEVKEFKISTLAKNYLGKVMSQLIQVLKPDHFSEEGQLDLLIKRSNEVNTYKFIFRCPKLKSDKINRLNDLISNLNQTDTNNIRATLHPLVDGHEIIMKIEALS